MLPLAVFTLLPTLVFLYVTCAHGFPSCFAADWPLLAALPKPHPKNRISIHSFGWRFYPKQLTIEAGRWALHWGTLIEALAWQWEDLAFTSVAPSLNHWSTGEQLDMTSNQTFTMSQLVNSLKVFFLVLVSLLVWIWALCGFVVSPAFGHHSTCGGATSLQGVRVEGGAWGRHAGHTQASGPLGDCLQRKLWTPMDQPQFGQSICFVAHCRDIILSPCVHPSWNGGLTEVSKRTWSDSQSPYIFSASIDPPGKEEKKNKTLKCRWSRLFELLRSWPHF